jgi:trans-aconitate methyltransferase
LDGRGETTSEATSSEALSASLWRKLGDPLVPASIYAAARLRLLRPTIERAATVEEIAQSSGADPRVLSRLLELLRAEGFLECVEATKYRATPLGRLLEDPGVRTQVLFWFEVHVPYVLRLDHSVQTGKASFDSVHGRSLYQFLDGTPQYSSFFRTDLGQGSAEAEKILSTHFDFGRVRRVADLGGSNGALLAALLSRWPHLQAVLFDSAMAVADAPAVLGKAGLLDRCAIVPGDFFRDPLPSADVYLLSWVVCEWTDEQVVQLLANCRRAMGPRSRLLVLEPLAWEEPLSRRLRELDLLISATVGGHLRALAEFEALLPRAGLAVAKATRTGAYMDLVEAAPTG